METIINVIQARDVINNNQNCELIDLRSPEEFEKSTINSARNIPLNELPTKIPTFDPKKEYLLLCKDGRQSIKAQELLNSCGLKSSIIRGGFKDWVLVIDSSLKF